MNLFRANQSDVYRIEECARRCCEEHGPERMGGLLNWQHYRGCLEGILGNGTEQMANGKAEPAGAMWLYEDMGRVVGGFCGAWSVAPLTGLKRASRVFVYVLPEYRGKLSLLRLIRLFEGWSRQSGCTTAAMSWMSSMPEGTKRAYEALGYREQETMYLKVL